jgi:hypothetical protein
MSKVFPKLAKSITLAAKNGGPDPESNAPLRVAIHNAKAQNLSRENIEAAIKRAAGKDAADISEVTYEGKGPHGTLFFIEVATDNSNRSVTNIKTILNKNGGQLVNSGALDFIGEGGRRFSPAEGAQILALRPGHPRLAPAPGLPDDTRLWAALQQIGGGTWGGSVFDVDAILNVIRTRAN